MNKITVEDFVKEFKNKADKTDFAKKHIAREYVPYEEKTAACERVIKITSYDTVGTGENQRRFFHVNTRARYMFFMLEVLRLYTDLDISFKDGRGLEIFNLIEEANARTYLLAGIPEREFDLMTNLLAMTAEDVMNNERSIAGYLDSKFTGVSELLSKGLEIADKFMTKVIEDESFINKMKNKIEKVMK